MLELRGDLGVAMTEEHRASTAQQEAYEFIRSAILGGTIPTGSRINIDEIAESLSISRMPVREALRQLDSEGLITIRPNRGAVVASLTTEEIEEFFLMRAALEPLAVRLAVPRFTKGDFLDLRLHAERLERAEGTPVEWLRRHKEFHNFINERSGRRNLIREIKRVTEIVEPYLLNYIAVYKIEEIPGHEHRTIVAAIELGDADAAEKAMRDHIAVASSGILAHIDNRRPS